MGIFSLQKSLKKILKSHGKEKYYLEFEYKVII